MVPVSGLTRRDALRKALLFSGALMLPRGLRAAGSWADKETLHLFALGDWGSGADENQTAVARAMREYASGQGITPHAMLMLGDNFYGPLPGVDSPRWRIEFEEMYPASAFPGPCHAILGNHDYDDQPGGEKIQMEYAKTPGTRWRMPDRWYRLDLPEGNPVLTLLCTNTHYNKLSKEDVAAQNLWLAGELAAERRAPWMVVCGHHPVLSCGPHHGDSKFLGPWRDLFEKHRVHGYLCGHEHDLQHLREENRFTDWLVSGGGGKALHPVKPNDKTRFARQVFGFLHLAISASVMRAIFVDSQGGVLYQHERKRDEIGTG